MLPRTGYPIYAEVMRWFYLGGAWVLVPDSWDEVTVQGLRYVRRRRRRAWLARGQHEYWVSADGRVWARTRRTG